MEILTKRLNELIVENKISKYKLAKELRYGKATILNWCDGKNEPKATQIKELAVYFNVTTDYLLGLENSLGEKIEVNNSYKNIKNVNHINNNSGTINIR